MLKRMLPFLVIGALALFGFVAAVSPAGTAAAQPAPAVPLDTPQPILNFFQNISEWRVAAGFIYLTDDCTDFSSQTSAYIRRRAVNGSVMTVLESINSHPQCRTFRHAAADESGIYYYNRNLGRIEAIYSDSPLEPPTPLVDIGDWGRIGFGDGISNLRAAGSYVYWIEHNLNAEFSPDDVAIRRVPKSGGAPTTMLAYSSLAAKQVSLDGFGVTRSHIWWTDGDGLNRISTCLIQLCLPGTNNKVTEFPTQPAVHGHIVVQASNVYWWNEDESPERIRRTSCSFFGSNCSTATVHTTTTGIHIIGLAANSDAVFWTESLPLADRRLRRRALSGGAAATVAENVFFAAPYLDVDGVIFQTDPRTIARLPFDAEAITREIGLSGWEVTQGIQRLENDVPLVAGKSTYVRLYPTLDDGADVGAAMAELHASRGGQPLPGSPIYPLTATIPITSGLSVADRGVVDSGWLFRLPESWTRTGDGLIPQDDTTITLRAVVDPYGVYADADDPGNNELAGQFTFTAKAPTCMIMRPVITHQSYQPVYGIKVAQVVELSESVLPTAHLITFPKNDPLREIDWCWKGPFYGPFCSTPYELRDDDSGLLTKMGWLDFWADVPPICYTNNARSLYAGIIHKDADWDWSGLARRGKDQLLTKVPAPGDPVSRFNGLAMTMVHEMGHSYDRRHVNCGGPLNPDPNYPYPTNLLDFNLSSDDVALHFGFDPLRRSPVSATSTADFMSYCGPEWYSDYTWKAIFNSTRDPFSIFPGIPATGHLVRIAGLVDESQGTGTLDYAWKVPVDAASDRLLREWSASPGPAAENGADQNGYHVQLVGVDGQVLADQAVEIATVEDGDPGDPVPFEVTLAAPAAPVARVQLMAEDALLAVLAPGAGQPTVAIDQPAGGTVVGEHVTVSWTASDPDGDRLYYTVLYSPNGDEWSPLLVNYGGSGTARETVTLDISGEAGSDGVGALVRVLASDGYNTTVATSQPFSVARREPFAIIASPAPGQTFRAGETIPLKGVAGDPEDGLIAHEAFVWSTGELGPTADLDGMAPGPHTVQLTVADSDGLQGTSDVAFTVAPLSVPETAGDLVLDGRCDDAGYRNASQLPLAAYAVGARADAHIVRTGASLWLCLTGLQGGGYAGLLLDADNSGEPVVQSGDFGYFVRRDGTRFVQEGNGSALQNASPHLLSARIADNGAVWSAELQVDDSAFGDWRRRVALAIGHFEQAGGVASTWPRSAVLGSPQSWAQTNLGLAATLTGVNPESAVLGSGDIALTVSGADFDEDHVILWNGAAMSTTLVDPTTLAAVIPAAAAPAAGAYDVAAGLDGAPELATVAHPFVVYNPQPLLAGLTPDTAQMGSDGASVTVTGAGFVDGATVLWNGEALATVFVSPTVLTISLTAEALAGAVAVPVVVVNPEPAVGPSNTLFFVISSGMDSLLLPVLRSDR
ncbi:MAG: IPT/TIG domain-containing protein [Candidatus Promineifilaceae bacterium]|nr:IPT/TIG domain-containing protein [Candidatus Promineifilaceae bacterium]